MSNLAKKIFLAINYLEAFGNRSALTFLSIVLSPIQKTTLKKGGFEVAESTEWLSKKLTSMSVFYLQHLRKC